MPHMRLAGYLGQNDMGLPPPLTLMETMRCNAGFTILLQPHSQMHVVTQAYANLVMGPLQVSYSLLVLSLPLIFYGGIFGNVTFLHIGSDVANISTQRGSTFWVLHHVILWSIPLAGILLALGLWFMPGVQ